MFIEGETFDDLLRKGLCAILEHGLPIKPRKKEATEIIGVSLKLHNPCARFSRTENRAVLFSALGETLWYLSGSDDFEMIEHYIPRYREHCETPPDVAHSEAAYGPRLKRQMNFVKEKIKKRDTRNAVISIYREEDHNNKYEYPCTCTLQFFPRAGNLHMVAQMRSNDVYKGMAHDIFAFTFLQELLARSAGLEMGSYMHQVGSFHLYDRDRAKAERYIEGGLADTIPMVPMPPEDPECGLEWLLSAAAALRKGDNVPSSSGIAPYWQDLANLLRIKSLRDARNKAGLLAIRDAMHSDVFRTFIQDEIEKA
ncbi:MAG TPA: thymidylate synthase [Beijerinckiaceae bacterium]|jgi:thymidylate synthase